MNNKKTKIDNSELLNALLAVCCNLELTVKNGYDIGFYGRMALKAADEAVAKAKGNTI